MGIDVDGIGNDGLGAMEIESAIEDDTQVKLKHRRS